MKSDIFFHGLNIVRTRIMFLPLRIEAVFLIWNLVLWNWALLISDLSRHLNNFAFFKFFLIFSFDPYPLNNNSDNNNNMIFYKKKKKLMQIPDHNSIIIKMQFGREIKNKPMTKVKFISIIVRNNWKKSSSKMNNNWQYFIQEINYYIQY